MDIVFYWAMVQHHYIQIQQDKLTAGDGKRGESAFAQVDQKFTRLHAASQKTSAEILQTPPTISLLKQGRTTLGENGMKSFYSEF